MEGALDSTTTLYYVICNFALLFSIMIILGIKKKVKWDMTKITMAILMWTIGGHIIITVVFFLLMMLVLILPDQWLEIFNQYLPSLKGGKP